LGEYPVSRLLSYLHGQSAWSTPGAHYFYSNANYLLLALIIDNVTDGTHADVISQRILQPLGLADTYYKNEPGYPAPPGLVNSYEDLAGDGRLMNVTDMAVHNAELFMGNAGLIATSADFAAFLEGLFDGRVVSQESLGQMLARSESRSYGLGLSFSDTPYGPAVGHRGGDLGVQSEVRRFPDLDATLVLLVNGGDGGITARLFNDLWEEAMAAALEGL
jgi:D-alanyl-D-alanine carboxypeptidase